MLYPMPDDAGPPECASILRPRSRDAYHLVESQPYREMDQSSDALLNSAAKCPAALRRRKNIPVLNGALFPERCCHWDKAPWRWSPFLLYLERRGCNLHD